MPQGQGRVAFLPYTRVTLKSLIPKPHDYMPISLGEHIKKMRLQLELLQKDVARQLGVSLWTVINWENGLSEPPVRAMPAIFQFLGYNPFPKPKTVSQRLLAKWREKGWSIKEAAGLLGVDPGTWASWERGRIILYRRH